MLAQEISENPGGSGDREGLDEFRPISMTVGIRKKQRYPYEQPKHHEHQCQQANREKCHSIRKKRKGSEPEQNGRRYRPKYLTWWNPCRNKLGRSVKIKRLFERKGGGRDAKKNTAEPIQWSRWPDR